MSKAVITPEINKIIEESIKKAVKESVDAIIKRNIKNESTIIFEEIAKSAAAEAIKEYKKDEKLQLKKKSLYNIGLLMDHYLEFVEHYEKIKFRASDIEDYEGHADIDLDLSVDSIKRSKTRTLIIVTQIKSAIKMLEADMDAKKETEKYKVIEKLYMDKCMKDLSFNERIKKTAELINCGESTVRRWNTEMLNKLAIKLFGIDGLKLDV